MLVGLFKTKEFESFRQKMISFQHRVPFFATMNLTPNGVEIIHVRRQQKLVFDYDPAILVERNIYEIKKAIREVWYPRVEITRNWNIEGKSVPFTKKYFVDKVGIDKNELILVEYLKDGVILEEFELVYRMTIPCTKFFEMLEENSLENPSKYFLEHSEFMYTYERNSQKRSQK